MCSIESRLCPFRYFRIICRGSALFSWQKMALLLERNPPVRMNGAIFISFYLERSVVGRWKKPNNFSAEELRVLSKGQLICVLSGNKGHLLHHHRNPCSTALQRYRPGFSPESHLSSSRAKHVHLTSCSIWQKKKKNIEGKAKEVCLPPLFLFSSLSCNHKGEWVA